MAIYVINLNDRERVERVLEGETLPERDPQRVYFTSAEKAEEWCLRARTNRTVKTLIEAYNGTFEKTPADTIKASVEAMGADDTRYAIASIVNYFSHDGRISRRNKEYAATIKTCNSNSMAIHLAHIDQLMDAMRKYDLGGTGGN